jgi:hypothetical protein
VVLPVCEDNRLCRRMANRLDAVTVWIEHKGGVVVRVIVRPKPRRPIVAPAGYERRRMKGIDRGPIGGTETQMRPGDWRPQIRLACDGEFDPEGSQRGAVIRTAAIAEIDNAVESEWTKRSIIEAAAALDIGDAERDMVQHCSVTAVL